MSCINRHLREIDCSLAVVGGLATILAMALNPGSKQYTGRACFMVTGDKGNKGRQAGPMSGLLLKIPMCYYLLSHSRL